jgi:cytochrome c-type biogenesis protein CcsB
MKYLFSLCFAVLGLTAHADLGTPLESIPIQDAGRLKPFGTFAQESLQLIYGKRSFQDKSATEVVFTWLLIPEHWSETPIIEVSHSGLREALKISSSEKYFSAKELFSNPRIPLVIQELQTLRSRQEKLNPYFSAVSRLENQLALFQAIKGGQALRFVPSPDSDSWKSVPELDGELRDAFGRVSKGFVDSIAAAAQSGAKPVPSEEFKAAVTDFIAKAKAQAPDKYADMTRIAIEEHFNHFHPFMWAWIAYLAGVICLYLHLSHRVPGTSALSWAFLIAGFLLHGYGMAIRVYLAGRPPVSNMYETVVWVPFGCVLFGMILAKVQKSRVLLACASSVAIFCLILTNLSPTVLDSSIQPLEPVLRSTFWLSTHVLIITISYAAFFLAFATGDLMLFYYLRDEKRYAKEIAMGTNSIYRALQIGIVLLAGGIILGGIWADYSWGRFWGWDPKETWALIALLGYLALLHGRLVGWVKNFQLAVGAVIAFLLVIMSWYGVNMVLGAGLHTYGFGAGGIEYVLGFVVLHILFVVYVTTVRYQPSKNPTR